MGIKLDDESCGVTPLFAKAQDPVHTLNAEPLVRRLEFRVVGLQDVRGS